MKQKVVLIMPRIRAGSFDKGFPNEPPIGLAYLAAVLKEKGIDCRPIDMRFGYSAAYVLNMIKSYSPDIVGVSFWSLDRNKTIKLINMIKNETDIPVVVGGPHVSAVKKECLNETEADFAIKGEGEFTILELMEHLRGERETESIYGLIYRRENNIIENPDRVFNDLLDDLPVPAYEDFEPERYLRKNRLHIVTSRGCPYGCNYCSVRLSMGRNFRPRSPENVIEELSRWCDIGYSEFVFTDDCFSFDIQRAERICDLIVERDMNISWHLDNGIRVDRVSERLLSKMKKAGLKSLMFGVESADNETLKRINKNITFEQAGNAVEMARRIGFESVGATFIIGHPGETFAKFRKNLESIKTWHLDKVKFYTLVPYPGTELYKWITKHGKFVMSEDQYLNSRSYYSKYPIFETEEFPAPDRKKAFVLGYKYERKVLSDYLKKLYRKRYGSLAGFAVRKISYSDTLINLFSRFGIVKLFKKCLKIRLFRQICG